MTDCFVKTTVTTGALPCSSRCRAWSKVEKECEFVLAARAFRRLLKHRPATPYPPEVGV